MSVWAGHGSMRGVALAVLVAGCSVYDESLLEAGAASDIDGVAATSTEGNGGTGASSTSGAGGGNTDDTDANSSGGDTSTDTATEVTTTTATTTVGGTGGMSATSGGGTGGDAGSGGDGGSGATSAATGGSAGTGGSCSASCSDECPDDPDKTEPGICGCGVPDEGASGCADMVASLEHRYSFDDTGTTASDAAGQADGAVVNTSLDGSGVLTLTGQDSDEYVELPGGIISSLSDATVEVWFTWDAGDDWERVFDFGSSTGAAGEQGTGDTYFFLTPRNSTHDVLQVTFTDGGFANEILIEAAEAPSSGVQVHAVIVVNDMLALYLDGALVDSVAFDAALSSLSDVNNWIGRSQYMQDSEFGGTLDELRIYSAALSAEQISLSYASGPDPDFLAP